jgi:hypothetical protein
VHAEFWLVGVKEGDFFADTTVSGRIILERILKESNGERKMDLYTER